MLFSSMTFIYFFLPIVLLLYFVTKKELHNPILLIASMIFYAWDEPKYLAIMLLTIVINYLGAILIDKYSNRKKQILLLTILTNLGLLVYFKYFNFIVDNCNNLFHSNISVLDIVMPIGISFYTFQALSYVIDVYRGECKVQKNIYKIALYICLFPQLVSGPILKYHDVADQIDSREINFDKVKTGVQRFIIGLSKKVLIANTMGAIADKIFVQDPHNFSHAVAWIGSVTYTIQLYFDFSGYSDMAVGLGLIFGFKFMENFNYPFVAKSVTEFWRRWHISLSTWFKQYVYIPLGGSRCSKLKKLRNLGIVFLLTGIWHGAEWTFVVWGIYHGFFIIIENIFNIKEFENKPHKWYVNAIMHFYCVFEFLISCVIFRADNMKYAWDYLMNMFGFLHLHTEKFSYALEYYFDNIALIIFIVAILCCVPLFKNMIYVKNKYAKVFVNVWLLFLFYLSTISIASDTYNPFIYFRF